MRYLKRMFRKVEYFIPYVMKAVGVVGFVCVAGAAGNSDFCVEAHIADFPQTKPLLIIGSICLGIVLVYVILMDGFEGGDYDD